MAEEQQDENRGMQQEDGRESDYARLHRRVVFGTIVASCSFVVGAENGMLAPYLGMQDGIGKAFFSAGVSVVVFALPLIWFHRKYGSDR